MLSPGLKGTYHCFMPRWHYIVAIDIEIDLLQKHCLVLYDSKHSIGLGKKKASILMDAFSS